MLVIEQEMLTATGWVPADGTGRYWRHAARYGEAIFDRFDVETKGAVPLLVEGRLPGRPSSFRDVVGQGSTRPACYRI